MSMAEKLRRFMLFVRHENSARVNDIQTIENAIPGCHLDLKTLYEAEDVGVYQGRHTFSGKLTLSGIFLARAVGQVKKELKHECYKLALQVWLCGWLVPSLFISSLDYQCLIACVCAIVCHWFCVCARMCTCTHMCVCVCVCMCVCMCTCMHACVCVCVCVLDVSHVMKKLLNEVLLCVYATGMVHVFG